MKSAWVRQGLDIGSRVFKIGIIRAAFNHGYHVLSTLFLSKDLAQQDILLLPCYDLWQSLGYLGAKIHGLIGYTFVEMMFFSFNCIFRDVFITFSMLILHGISLQESIPGSLLCPYLLRREHPVISQRFRLFNEQPAPFLASQLQENILPCVGSWA